MPLTASHSPLLTLHMLWVDLSKCFITFSRAVGQLLQARRGVPAQVRKAVWNLYSRPHGSFDSAFGCLPHTLGAYAAPCRRSLALTPTHDVHLRLSPGPHTLYFSAKSTQKTPPALGTRVAPALGTGVVTQFKIRVSLLSALLGATTHERALWLLAMLHTAGSDSAPAATYRPLSRHTRTFPLAHTSTGHQPGPTW